MGALIGSLIILCGLMVINETLENINKSLLSRNSKNNHGSIIRRSNYTNYHKY